MTQEQYEFLKPQRENMRLAAEAGYIRGVRQADMRKVSGIYSELVGGGYSCGSCLRDMRMKFKELWPYFLEYERTVTGTDSVPVKRTKKSKNEQAN